MKKERVAKLPGVLGAAENRKGSVQSSTLTATRKLQQRNPGKSKIGVLGSAQKQELAVGRPFAVFDIDGTLIRWQLYHAITDALARKSYIDPKTYEQMRGSRQAWKKRTHAESFKEYERMVVQAYDQAVTNLTLAQFMDAASEVFDEYKDQVYTFSRDLIIKLKKQGYVLLAISGSQMEIVEMIAKYYGFNDYVGSTYVREDSKFTGEKIIASKDKSVILKSLIKKHHLGLDDSIAVGDTESDIPMLEAVETPITLNPTRGLFEHAKKAGWKIVIERKNMVYELENNNGTYVLRP